jgi:hypothetical protein
MKTSLDHPSQLANYKPTQLATGLLQRVQKNGLGAIAKQTAVSQSALKLQAQVSVNATVDSRAQSKVQVQTARSVQQHGQTVNVSTKQAVQGETSQQHRADVSQASRQVVQGQVNGKPVYSNVERDVHQVTVGQRNAEFEEARKSSESATRNVTRNGNATRVTLSTKSSGDRSRTDGVAAEQRTETEVNVRTYDAAGALVSDKASRQAVTVRQEQEVAVKAHGEASRELQQETTVVAHQEGKVSVQQVRTETSDATTGHQEIETQSQSKTATLVENLGADGEVLSARAGSQQATANEARTIDTSRDSHSEQTTQTLARPDQSATSIHSSYETKAKTVDHVETDGNVQQFNGDGALVREQAYARDVTATTTEKRSGEAQASTATTKENGAVTVSTGVKAEETVAVGTRVVAEQGGAKTERDIESESHSEVRGELLNRVDAEGRRTISFDAQQSRETQTEDLAVAANGQGRLVESETKVAQALQGKIEYSPETQQVGARLGAGAILVDVRSATGLRASFRLDQGELEFDFSSETAMVSHQEITSGKVVQENGESTVVGPGAETQRASVESVHFHGHLAASVDAAGNRVLDLDGQVNQDAAAVLVANQGQGLQAERSHTELEISGRLAVNRQVSTDGSLNRVQTQGEAEMNVSRVETREAAGVNMPALTRLTSADAFRAGFQAYRGALQLHVGGFDLSISFLA